ncbi:hypothetical protein CHH91_04595 [Virgibacillus sp. 7505]|uniref:hypothetical protein n=1 Tax=Virgibacillus sp. 7505 TaxID=2022548 RepID=UPI000BA7D6E0|nr:hypothetical protein [Virgibacillus sp. 7505]PAE17288.1 hypothetical protein CHH91_04595 [Virgibacillus sp. 7505]
MDFQTINAYLESIFNSDAYTALDNDARKKAVFSATELLKDKFDESKLTDRAVAIQVMYMLEGEEEYFAVLKRHGITSYSTKGVSVSISVGSISPDVLTILGYHKAGIGRLI